MRIARPLGVAAIGVVASTVAVVGISVVALRSTSGSPSGATAVRSFADAGVSVRVPEGWRATPGGGDPSTVVEVQHRPVFGLFATRGMWVSRWADEGARESLARWADGDRDGAIVAGREAAHRVERVGPSIVQRLPAAVTTHRSAYRFLAYDRVFEVGFWGPASTIGDAQERSLLSGIGVEPPAPIELVSGGWALRVPGTWVRGADCDEWASCAFAPGGGGVGAPAWVYVMDRKGNGLADATDRLLDQLREGGVESFESTPMEIDGRGASGIRFPFRERAGEVTQIEEVLVPARGEGFDPQRFVLVALGWRTEAGRAELDSVIATLRLYHPAP
jgi:hypothetical protein